MVCWVENITTVQDMTMLCPGVYIFIIRLYYYIEPHFITLPAAIEWIYKIFKYDKLSDNILFVNIDLTVVNMLYLSYGDFSLYLSIFKYTFEFGM